MLTVQPLLQHINPSTFLVDYLRAKGIQRLPEYLHPNEDNFDKPRLYPNIEQAVDCFHKHVQANSKFGVLADSDFDGQASASMMVNFLTRLGFEVDKSIVYFMHTAKQHGLRPSPEENIVQQVLDSDVNLLFIPDAGSNDTKECSELRSHGIDIIILDHHEITVDNPYAIVVNHHLGQGLNTDLPGAGVTLKFIERYCKKFDEECPYYIDLVASAIISDVCNLSSLENRAYVNEGLNIDTVQNPMLKLMFEKSCRKGVNPEGLAWGANPLVNSLCRGESYKDKLTFFRAMALGENTTEGLKVANRAHRNQTKAVKEIMEKIEPTIDNSHKAIVAFTDAEDKNYTGLVANKIMSAYGKPVVLLREASSTTWSGSIRSMIPLASKINESKLASCQGHEVACGVFLKKSNLNRFINWLDTLDLSATPAVPVTAVLSPKEVTIQLSELIDDWKILWGAGVEKPQFAMDIVINSNEVNVYEKRTTTIKANYKGLDFLLFFAKDKEVEAFKNGGKCRVIFDIGLNEWNGVKTPQCIIDRYEFIEEKEDNWEDAF